MNDTTDKLWTKQFIMLTICTLLMFLNLQMVLPSLPVYVKDRFQANDFTVSLFVTMFAVSAIISRLFAAKALEFGKRNLILFLGLLLALLATIGYLWSSTVVLLLLMRVIFGIGFGMSSTALPTMASNIIPRNRLGEGLGYFGLSSSIAMSIGPVIGNTILDKSGFNTLVYVTLFVIALIFPLVYPLTRNKPIVMKSVKQADTDQPKGLMTSLMLPSLLNLLLSVSYGGLLSFVTLFGKEVSLANASFFFLFNAAAVILIRPISGKIYDRKGHNFVLIPSAISVIIGLLLLSQSTSMGSLALSALFYGIGFGTIQPTLQSWMVKSVPVQKQGLANSMYFNSLDLGIAIGAMVLGQIASASNYATMYRFTTLFLVLFSVLCGIHMYRAIRIRRGLNGTHTSASQVNK